MPLIIARFARVAFVFMLLLVTVLSLAPVDQPDFSPNDKVNHFIAYAAMTFVAAWGWVVSATAKVLRVRVIIVIGLLCFGGLIEFVQGFTGYRFASIADIVANSVGIVIGLVIFELSYWLHNKIKR